MSVHCLPCLSISILLPSPSPCLSPPTLSFPFPLCLSSPHFLPVSHPLSLFTPLPSHLSISLSPSAHLCIYLPQYHPPQKSHIEIGFPATSLPYALVSPMVGCFCPRPRLREEMKGKGDGFRGIYREFLNSSATPPPIFPTQSDSLVSQRKTDWDPRAVLFWLPTHPPGSPP